MNNKGGLLVYKCRRCGKVNKSIHIPDSYAMKVLTNIMNDVPVPKEIQGTPAGQIEICMCDDGNLGLADLIGLEYDNIDS